MKCCVTDCSKDARPNSNYCQGHWASIGSMKLTNEVSPWYLVAQAQLSFKQKLLLLFGKNLFVGFFSPDKKCHAACNLAYSVQKGLPTSIPWSYVASPEHTVWKGCAGPCPEMNEAWEKAHRKGAM